MAGRCNNIVAGIARLFKAPYIVSNQYRAGRQPYSPGESQMDSGGPAFQLMPWPNAVPSILAQMLSNQPGLPRAPGLGIYNNAQSQTPDNGLFIAGFSGKSRG